MLYPIFKNINPATRIGVSNLKYEIEKSTLAKFGNNAKELLDDMSSNYSIFIDKGEHHEYYVRKISEDILSGSNSNFHYFIEMNKYDWYTGTSLLS